MSSSEDDNSNDVSENEEEESIDENVESGSKNDDSESLDDDNLEESGDEDGKKSDKEADDEENSSDHERTNIRGELKTMSFEELMKLKQKLGSKVYNEAIFGSTNLKRNTKKVFKRENSNRPMEMSSKKQVPLGLGVKQKIEEVIADPRFNSNCGDFDSTKFKKRYDFINDMRETELKTLKTNLRKCEDPDEAAKIKFLIQRLKNQLHEEKKRKERLAEQHQKSEEVDKAKEENKKPFYVKKNLKKAEEMVKQYEELKQSGKLQKHLEKRRKKSIIKDRKKLKLE